MESKPTYRTHIGELIKQKVEELNVSVTDLAHDLSIERRSVYNIYEKPDIHTAMLRRISDALKYDFFKHLSEEIEDLPAVAEKAAPYENSPARTAKICLVLELDNKDLLSAKTIEEITELMNTAMKRPT